MESKGNVLIHIYEDDWLYKQNIVKSKILSLLGKYEQIIDSEFEVKEISIEHTLQFLNDNDLMNSFKENNLRFGLYHENKLVSLMTFEKYDANLDNYVITSFC